ncbi:glyoxalase [Flavobacteriaceae bacterium]|nr:glyoxalase [Flavobacteriaceae bacterium]
MNNRSKNLIQIRPYIVNMESFDKMSIQERFQNETLRPILKLQNSLFIQIFQNYIEKHKGIYHKFNLNEKLNYIESCLIKDQKLRNYLKGIIIGHFTLEEYGIYKKQSSELSKRMINMLNERLKDRLQLFDSAFKS